MDDSLNTMWMFLVIVGLIFTPIACIVNGCSSKPPPPTEHKAKTVGRELSKCIRNFKDGYKEGKVDPNAVVEPKPEKKSLNEKVKRFFKKKPSPSVNDVNNQTNQPTTKEIL